ncbi:MAG: ATPase, T2SS/T4P/T4SS family [Minisyncoccia bacterium]|jgi:type II secretory ATPase GspE/PulE/Tfp pilus assembly ATPase PilB-like protein
MPDNPKKGILIIEDNPFMAELLAEKINNQGFSASSAYDGSEGLEKLENIKPSLVLLDLPLSGSIDGFEVLRKIRETYDAGTLPVITLFNLDDQESMQKSLQLGANDYVVKAFMTTDQIVDKIKEILEGKIPEHRPAVAMPSQQPTSYSPPEPDQTRAKKFEVPDKLKGELDSLLMNPENEIPIISLVDRLMEYAFLARASDIHIEPLEDKVVLRLRVDGILHDVFAIPKSIQSGVITRIKVLTGMRTDEHQAAQDGRFKTKLTDPPREFDVRVSIIPTYYGENAVLRILAEQTQINRLDDLALNEADKIKIRHAVKEPYGMILATGPTGSGKTTTLYTILKELSTREVSIITIEDPIEYSLEGVDQIQVNTRTGLTFAAGLRSILRQDPNVVMVGEIRDEETASIAVNAALTGHKLLSTIHTNDAATTLPRLLDMGIEPFLVASTVNVAIGQRLVRTICADCKTQKKITEAEFKNLADLLPPELIGNNHDFFYGKGCGSCGNTGYFGRVGVYEVLEMNDFIREAIMSRADASEIKKIAIKNGMVTLIEDGFKKALAGMTTIEEILRVVHE